MTERPAIRRPWMSALFLLLVIGCSSRRDYVPAGPQQQGPIAFEYAIYYLPNAPATLGATVNEKLSAPAYRHLHRVSEFPKTIDKDFVATRLEKNAQADYQPPELGSLRYAGRGLNPAQTAALPNSKEVLILRFAHPREDVWCAARVATELALEIANETGGIIWDDETREVFSPEEWKKTRLDGWTAEIPRLQDHTTIHRYKQGEFVRGITLGMTKFGLPDIVVNDFSWSLGRNIAHTMNLLGQSLAEGATVEERGAFELELRKIRDASVREPQVTTLGKNAKGIAHLILVNGKQEEGDPDNRLIEILCDAYDGPDGHAKQEAMVAALFGFEDETQKISHTDELLAVSRKARAHLPSLRAAFARGLEPGEYILLKAPFTTDTGGNEWMWVEVTRWDSDRIHGLLANEPDEVSGLHSGQLVKVDESDVFDYIRRYRDGHTEGNTTGDVIRKMTGE